MENYKKVSILIVASEFPPLPGGIGNHAFHLANEFSKNHSNVIVLTEKRVNSESEWLQFCKSTNFKIIGISRNRFIAITYLKRIFYFIYLTFKLHPIIYFSGKFSIWLSAINPSKNKSFAIIHGSEIKCIGVWRKIFHLGLKNVHKVISVSNYTQYQLLSNYTICKSKCIVINNGFYFGGNIKKSIKSIKKTLQFITVGGMHKRKGQQNFIKALPTIVSKFGDIKYKIAGIPQELKYFEELAKMLNVSEYVDFYISPNNEMVVKLLEDSDIFIMLSENLENGDFEGFGIALLEAMSLGKPGIGSRNTGIEDAISNHFSGILVNHNSEEEILSAIVEIIDNYDIYSINAINWSEKFRWHSVIKKYEYYLMQN